MDVDDQQAGDSNNDGGGGGGGGGSGGGGSGSGGGGSGGRPSSSSKKPKQKKSQRGLGVAQLERIIRLEKQQKNDAPNTNPTSPSSSYNNSPIIQSPMPISSIIPITPTFPNYPHNTNQPRCSLVSAFVPPLSNPSPSNPSFVNINNVSMSCFPDPRGFNVRRPTLPIHGNVNASISLPPPPHSLLENPNHANVNASFPHHITPSLENPNHDNVNSSVSVPHQMLENPNPIPNHDNVSVSVPHRESMDISCMHSGGSLFRSVNCPIALPQDTTQQPMMNVPSVNYPSVEMEHPSNQSMASGYSLPTRLDDKRKIVAGMKRPCPSSQENLRSSKCDNKIVSRIIHPINRPNESTSADVETRINFDHANQICGDFDSRPSPVSELSNRSSSGENDNRNGELLTLAPSTILPVSNLEYNQVNIGERDFDLQQGESSQLQLSNNQSVSPATSVPVSSPSSPSDQSIDLNLSL